MHVARLHLVLAVCLAAQLLGWSLPVGARSAQESQSRFRSGVDVIEVAVVARYHEGSPVTDLTEEEFTIRENGAPQRIAGFEHVSLPVFRRGTATRSLKNADVRDVSTNETIAESRVFVLVLDALHVAAHRNSAIRQQASRFIEEYVGPGDLAAVISPGASEAATEDFTSDKARLLAAISSFTGTKLKSYTQEAAGPFGLGGPREKEKMGSDSERAYRVYSLSSTLEALAGHLDRMRGRRKALILFSEGVDYDIGDVMGETQRYASEVTRAMDRAVGALMRTNVVMYTVDPRGLTTAEGDLIDNPIFELSPGNPDNLSERDAEREFDRSIASLRDAARATGGFLATDRGLTRSFEQIAQETSEYYIIRYAPSKPPKPGEFHSISVHVTRPGVSVTARKGYATAKTEAQSVVVGPSAEPSLSQRGGLQARSTILGAAERPAGVPAGVNGVPPALVTLLSSSLPKGGLGIRVQAIPFRVSDKKAEVRLLIEVLGKDFEFAERDGRADERVELALLTVDARGRATNGRSTTIDLHVPSADVQRVRTTGVRWLSQLDLAPGRYQLRVAGRASRTGATGMVTHTFVVPRFEPAQLSMSGITTTSLPSVLMLTKGKGWLSSVLDTPPSAARTFVLGDRVTAATEIYMPNPAQHPPDLRAEILGADGATILKMNQHESSQSVSPTTLQAAFRFDTASLLPGRYVLRVVAPEGQGQTIEQSLPFEVVQASLVR